MLKIQYQNQLNNYKINKMNNKNLGKLHQMSVYQQIQQSKPPKQQSLLQKRYSNSISRQEITPITASSQQNLNHVHPAHAVVKNIKNQPPFQAKVVQKTMKKLLQDKRQLFEYLEAERQFISCLKNQNINLSDYTKQRGKLASSLTEKKKSRMQIHPINKSKFKSNFIKVDENFRMLNQIEKYKKIKNKSLTVQVVHNKNLSIINPAEIDCRQYETLGFQLVNKQRVAKYQQKPQHVKRHKTQDQQKQVFANFDFDIESPKAQNIKISLNQRTNRGQNKLMMTKFGMTNFSPWAFPKDSLKNDFDLDFQSSIDKNQPGNQNILRPKILNGQSKVKNVLRVQNKKVTQIKKTQNNQKKMHINGAQRKSVANSQEDKQNKDTSSVFSLTKDNGGKQKKSLLVVNTSQNPNKKHIKSQKQQVTDKRNESNDIPISFQAHQILSQKISSKRQVDKQNYVTLFKKPSEKSIQPQKNLNLLRSEQVFVLQSQPNRISEIFAPKNSIKKLLSAKKLMTNLTQGHTVQRTIFPTKVSRPSEGQPRLSIVDKKQENQIFISHRESESQLLQIKKTEQFLKEIRINKNSISLFNSACNSKNRLKKFCQGEQIYKNHKNDMNDVFNEQKQKKLRNKNVFEQYNNYSNQVDDRGIGLSEDKFISGSFITESEQDIKRPINFTLKTDKKLLLTQLTEKKKAKTSLGRPLYEQEQNSEYLSGSTTKCLTEASLNGLFVLRQSKIKNCKNSYTRRKKHSLMKKKKGPQQSDEKSQVFKKHSFSLDNQNHNLLCKYDSTYVDENLKFSVVNPLTRQLYKKYASIIQSKKY